MKNLSIKKKLLSLAGLVVVSFLTIAMMYGFSVSVQHNADAENKRIANVEYNIQEITIGLLQASRNEKDFLLRKDIKYADQHTKTMKGNMELVNKLKLLVSDVERLRYIDDLGKLFEAYQDSFTKVVDINQRIGLDEEQGLHGNLRNSVHDVEHTLKKYSNDKLAVSMLMMRRHEKDFMAREKDKYINEMNEEQAVFDGQLAKSDFPERVKADIANQIKIYHRDFMAVTEGRKQLNSLIEVMRDKAHQIEPIFDTVHEMMVELKNKNIEDYKTAQNSIISIMTATLALVALVVITIVWFLAKGIVNAVVRSVAIAERISQGDLTFDVDVSSEDEMGRLQSAMKTMADKLRTIVKEVRESSKSVLQASGEISAGNMELSQRTEEQASSLEETASSMEEMTTTVKESADNAIQANNLAKSTRDEAKKGGEVVGRAVDAMSEIKNSSKKIADIIKVVEDIAFQTNLLALNAAVEAARAGEQGRGFAVVASEVRTLAGRSAESAKQIRNLIEDSVDKVQTGAELVYASGETLNEIVISVAKVADIVSEMAAASQEQSAGIEQVNNAVTQMDQMTQQNSALVEEAASASRALQDQALQLDKVISYFKVEDQNVARLTHSHVWNPEHQPNTDPQKLSDHAGKISFASKKSPVRDKSARQYSQGKKTGTYDNEWDEF